MKLASFCVVLPPFMKPSAYLWLFRKLVSMRKSEILLPTGSEEREVLWVGSIHVSILLSCQDMLNIELQLHKHEYSWVVKIRNTSEAVLGPQYTPWLSY